MQMESVRSAYEISDLRSSVRPRSGFRLRQIRITRELVGLLWDQGEPQLLLISLRFPPTASDEKSGGYFTRPELRVFATYAIWSDSLRDATTSVQEGRQHWRIQPSAVCQG
jgi:hypothetical protein